MAIRVMSLVWDSNVPAPERFTLLALADRADEDGYCWPSISTLAKKCATSDRTIQYHIKKLEESGLLTVDRPSDGESRRSSRYSIQLPVLRGMVDPEPVAPDGCKSDTGADPSPVQDAHATGARCDNDGCRICTPSIRDTSGDTPGGRARAAAPTRGTRIPDDFTATPDMVGWARANAPAVDGRMETERFKLYFESATGQKATKVDWVKAWKNWMLGEQKTAAARGRPFRAVPTPTPEYGTFEEILEAADADFVRRLIRVHYLMPDQPYDDRRAVPEWRRFCAREWITQHEASIRAALSERKRA